MKIQRPLGPANYGERPNIQLPRTNFDESSERDGGSESGENAAQEVGRQLEAGWRQFLQLPFT